MEPYNDGRRKPYGGNQMSDKLIMARTPEEAVRAGAEGCSFLAGGTEALRLGSPVDAEAYVSVRRTEAMRSVCSDAGIVTIGAACTFQELIDNSQVPAYLKEALHFMASRTRRNMATVGGNIAACRDDSFLLPTLIAASAVLELMDSDGRCEKIFAEDYVLNKEKYEGRLITSVTVPAEGIAIRSARSANTAQSHARLTAAMSLDEGRYKIACAVKNTGLFVLDGIAEALGGSDLSEDEIVSLVREDGSIDFEDDLLYGSADYRRYLLGITIALMYAGLEEKGGAA